MKNGKLMKNVHEKQKSYWIIRRENATFDEK